MATNYETISAENQKRYGTDIGRYGPMLLADRYDDRTHFIFELLQNAEDALGRRGEWHGPRKVTFELTPTHLILSHFGRPFDEADVRGVCGIAQSTKDTHSIGRFGIGFKSVYTFTDRPEIHSGGEDFAIENYVQPNVAERIARHDDETKIILPLKSDDQSARQEITAGFRRLGAGALLFLRNINEINWDVQGDVYGVYLRQQEAIAPNVYRVTVIGQQSDRQEVDQNWLVFHRDVPSNQQETLGRIEVAFLLEAPARDTPGRRAVRPLANSPLVVFFPTVFTTNLGFLIQGPYRTTPSRDNIPRGEPWNQKLIMETASLVLDAMRWMRDNAMLDTAALRCLPLDPEKFPKESLLAPIFVAVRQALIEEPLLPRHDGGYVAAKEAMLARTQDIRELLSPAQAGAIFGTNVTAWLTGDITLDREQLIRNYLRDVLRVTEVTPLMLIQRLSKDFLEAQSDEWVLKLYEFLNGQAALRRYLDSIPLLRLINGTHVVARNKGNTQAFLPTTIKTDFPTIRPAVCRSADALAFLTSLGITEPDPVDDVIRNLLPKYQQEEVSVDGDEYEGDIQRIGSALNSDKILTGQKEKLRAALRETNFVMVVDTGDGKAYVAKPGDVYIATERLHQLFDGVPDVLIVDNEYDCLRGENIRELLVLCGASRYLSPQGIDSELDYSEKLRLRKEAGLERASWQHEPEDFTLRGLQELLDFLPSLPSDVAAEKAKTLWDALSDLETRNKSAFFGAYRWGYSHATKVVQFDAAFVRQLNQAAWVPNADGHLVQPNFVVFDTLGWNPNAFLLAKIAFEPPKIDQLAKEVGIPKAVLDLLRRVPALITELLSRQSEAPLTPEADPAPGTTPDEEPEATARADGDVYGDAKDLYGEGMPDIPSGTPDPDGGDGTIGKTGSGGGHGGRPHGSGMGSGGSHGGSGGHTGNRAGGSDHAKRTPGHTGGRPFISYVGAHRDEEDDPDGLDQTTRMAIEGDALALIIAKEPELQRAPDGNPGFDLFEADGKGQRIRWIEVKAMTGSLENRAVGLSYTQFNYAREMGDAYWLYVVEHATDPAKARILRIQDPAQKARTFTFDSGWRQIAQTEPPAALSRRRIARAHDNQ